MKSILYSYGFYEKFYIMLINPFIHFPMVHRWSNRFSFFQVIFLCFFLCFWFLPHSFQPFYKSLGSLPKNRALPKSSSTSNNSSSSRSSSKSSSKPLQSLSKTSRAWFWPAAILTYFNEVRTMCKRGQNEVRNQILGNWSPKSPDKVFGSHMLSHFFQSSRTPELSAVEQKRKPSQAAAAGKSKETEEETKGE